MEVSKCKKHGIDKLTVNNDFTKGKIFYCPECAKDGSHDDQESKMARSRQEYLDKRLHNSMMSPRFLNKSLDNYEAQDEGQKKALRMSRWFVENFKDTPGMIFIGKTGTGKNHLACGIIHEIVKLGDTALITTAIKVIRSIKDSWRDNKIKEGEVIELYTKPGLLVIDEIGVQFGTDTEKLYISEVINDRYEAIKPTILLGNIKIKELIEQLGDRPIDRFREGGKIVQFDWDSYRKKI